jgi:hypothetical protein
MVTRKVPKFRGSLGRLLVLLPVAIVGPSCAANRVAQFEDTTIVLKNVCRIRFGQANINWWLLQGSVSSLDIAAEGGTQLSSAKFRVFEDANGNGSFDAGEKQKAFTSSPSATGLSVNNVSLSAGDIAGWNTDNISWQVEVTDSTNHVHVHTQHL